MEQLAVGQMLHARDPFVVAEVLPEVSALQLPVPFSTHDAPRKVDPGVLVGGPAAERHGAAVRAQGVIDEPCGGRPALAVERRLVQ